MLAQLVAITFNGELFFFGDLRNNCRRKDLLYFVIWLRLLSCTSLPVSSTISFESISRYFLGRRPRFPLQYQIPIIHFALVAGQSVSELFQRMQPFASAGQPHFSFAAAYGKLANGNWGTHGRVSLLLSRSEVPLGPHKRTTRSQIPQKMDWGWRCSCIGILYILRKKWMMLLKEH